MSYCTVDDVLHEFTPTLRKQMERDYGDDFEEIIARHIEKAEAFVNASLSRAYSVPLRSATGIVISAECKIAAYFSAIAYSEKDSVVQDKYETATMMLDYLVEANAPALVDEGLADDEMNTAGVLYGSYPQIYTDDELGNW
ncbi:MAG: DUF1320 family protein [Synergistaceae bacterium]|nr:DUF1320 family protein [Synergistaceae bacterium]MBQ6114676.1 DUF1320 family protein [Synergistaceae bacterium]